MSILHPTIYGQCQHSVPVQEVACPSLCSKAESKGVEFGAMDLHVKSLTFMQESRVCAQ